MGAVAIALGFLIGGGPSLLGGSPDEGLDARVSAATSSTTAPFPPSTTARAAAATTTTTTVPTTTTTTVAARPPSQVSVRVYNGSTKPGQAVRVGDLLKPEGYQLLAPGPSPSDPLDASVVHFVAGFEAEAAGLAQTLGLAPSAIAPMPAPVKDVGPAQLVLIVA